MQSVKFYGYFKNKKCSLRERNVGRDGQLSVSDREKGGGRGKGCHLEVD